MFFPPDIAHLRFTRTDVETAAQQHPAAVNKSFSTRLACDIAFQSRPERWRIAVRRKPI